MRNFVIVIPVYNDWSNLNRLLKNLNLVAKNNKLSFSILVINDFSNTKPKIEFKKNRNIIRFNLLNLNKNLGSQRAIAAALKYLVKSNAKKKNIIIMDADGQDDPNVIKDLIDTYKKYNPEIVVVERTNRNEPLWFKLLYFVHKAILFLFTGNHIRFGNFSLIKFNKIKDLVNKSDLWAAYPAAVISNLNNIKRIKSERKKRYSGNSKVNLIKLFNHSSRVFSVFKIKILTFSIIYYLIAYFFLTNSIFFLNLLFISLILGNIYNLYVDLNNKRDLKESLNFLKIKKRKVF